MLVGSRPTALITGASAGIGRALARELARGGYDLALIARNEAELASVAADCAREFEVRAQWLARDLALPESPREVFEWAKARGLEIDVIVNNAGFGVHGAFVETDIDREINLVSTQITAMLRLTKLFLPAMVERRKGKILNVASVYAFAPVPHQSVYGASKAFLRFFSESLACEVRDKGITVTALCPGITRTEFRSRAGIRVKNTAAGMSAEAVAAIGYRALRQGRLVSVPGGINRLFVFLVRHLPIAWLGAFVRRINRARGVSH